MARINIRRVVGSLMVGVVVTVLVAWILPGPTQSAYHRAGSVKPDWPMLVPEDWPSEPNTSFRRIYRTQTFIVHSVVRNKPSNFDGYWAREFQQGWPFRALVRYDASKYTPNGTRTGSSGWIELKLPTLHAGLTVPPQWLPALLTPDRPLPIKPLWPGFVANTIVWGSIPCTFMVAAGHLQRRRRARRGLCVQCAYPIADLKICPECGKAVACPAKGSQNISKPTTASPV